MNAIPRQPLHDARSRVNRSPAIPCRQAATSPHRACPVAPLDRLAARLRCVTLPCLAQAGQPLRFWSMAYRGDFLENAAMAMGMAGFVVVAAGKSVGVL